ncbi:hypothetical protein TNCV_1264171, partial [Trichonephila clavipes]
MVKEAQESIQHPYAIQAALGSLKLTPSLCFNYFRHRRCVKK